MQTGRALPAPGPLRCRVTVANIQRTAASTLDSRFSVGSLTPVHDAWTDWRAPAGHGRAPSYLRAFHCPQVDDCTRANAAQTRALQAKALLLFMLASTRLDEMPTR